MFQSKLRTLAVAGVMVASVVTLGAAGASNAFAGVQPSPSDSPTCPTPTPIRFSPTVSPTDHVRPEPCPTPTQPVPTPLNCNQQPPIRFAPTATPSDTVGLTAKYDHPTPTPTVTVEPRNRCVPWTFDVDQSDIAGLAVNDVEGQGAIPMHRWVDTQGSNPAIDTFSLGGNSVTILHSTLPTPDVNLATCTVTFDQPNGRFVILRGTGTGARWVSFNGQFDLLGMVSFPSIRHHRNVLDCPLRFLSLSTILRAIEFGTPVRGLPAPTFQDFSVQGSALLARR